MKAYLLKEKVLDGAQLVDLKRHQLEDSVKANWNSVGDGWSESEMRGWLIDNGYLKSDAEVKKDEVSFPPFLPLYAVNSLFAARYSLDSRCIDLELLHKEV